MKNQIQAERIVIFPLSQSDGIILQKDIPSWYTRKNFEFHEEWPDYALLGNLPLYLERIEGSPSHYGLGPWVIYSKLEKTVVGHIGFHGQVSENEVELGYYICPSFRKKGYIKEAIPLLLDWAKDKGYQQIYAQCDFSNQVSLKVLHSFGFIKIDQEDDILMLRKELN